MNITILSAAHNFQVHHLRLCDSTTPLIHPYIHPYFVTDEFNFGLVSVPYIIIRIRESDFPIHLKSHHTMDEMEYLQPSFDPSSLTMPRLRNILMTHNIQHPASAKKAQLVDAFNQDLKPQARKLLSARDRVRRTSKGHHRHA